MQKLALLLFFIIIITLPTSAQYTQLRENRGEVGVFLGMSSYRGDISPDYYTFSPSYGAFYKKLVNDYIGLRFNYERITLQGADSMSTSLYINPRKFITSSTPPVSRNLSFGRMGHDFSFMLELYFLKFIDGNNRYRFSPYLSFGIGTFQTTSAKFNNTVIKSSLLDSSTTISYPINLGFKYNVIGPLNIFGEASYRFTNSDRLDYFGDNEMKKGFQPSTSGNDQYFSFKAGLSYNLLKIYGPDKKLNDKKKSVFSGEDKVSKTSSKKGLISLFKRK
jgi:hypothetical protein